MKRRRLVELDDLDLFRLVRHGPTGSVAGQHEAAEGELVRRYTPLVKSIARRHKASSQDWDDLVSEGCLILVSAIRTFDPDRGLKFTTHAYPIVASALRRYALGNASPVKLSRRQSELLWQLRRFFGDQEVLVGQAGMYWRADLEQLVKDRHWSYAEVRDLLDLVWAPLSWDEPLGSDTRPLGEIVMNRSAVQADEAFPQLLAAVWCISRLMKVLKPEEWEALLTRVAPSEPRSRSVRAVAKELGIHTSKVQTLERRARSKALHPSVGLVSGWLGTPDA